MSRLVQDKKTILVVNEHIFNPKRMKQLHYKQECFDSLCFLDSGEVILGRKKE